MINLFHKLVAENFFRLTKYFQYRIFSFLTYMKYTKQDSNLCKNQKALQNIHTFLNVFLF